MARRLQKQKQSTGVPDRAQTPSRVSAKYVLAAIVLLSIVFRIALFIELNRTPLVDLDRWSETDMHYYDSWARQIAAGDRLSRNVPLPLHAWHVEIADTFLTQHPETSQPDVDAARREQIAPEAHLWARWMKWPQFYQDAMYPYLVAAIYKVFGPNVRWVLAWQLLLGVFTTVLIWDLTSRHFGPAVGNTAAAIALLCAPLMYYELLLLRESAIVFASVGVAWLADRAMARDRPIGYFAAGIALGLACLLKSSLLLLPIGMAIAIAAIHSQRPQMAARAVGILLAGVVLGTSPLVIRNTAVGVPAFALASGGPLTFVSANEATNQPDEGNYVNTAVLARFLGETDGGWAAALSAAFAGHSITSYAGLLWEKWSLAWHWYELPNNDNFYYAQQRVPLLNWLPMTAFVISPLALAGLILGVRRLRQVWMLYLLVALALAPLMIFYVLGRFRVVLLAAAIPFAALTIVEAARAARDRHFTRLAGIVVPSLLIGLWTGSPLPAGRPAIRTDDWLTPYLVRYQPRAQAAAERGDWQSAARACEEYFTEAPGRENAQAAADPQLPPRLADIHMKCATMWQHAGEEDRARGQAAAAEALLRDGLGH